MLSCSNRLQQSSKLLEFVKEAASKFNMIEVPTAIENKVFIKSLRQMLKAKQL